jgi:hypothetical protein
MKKIALMPVRPPVLEDYPGLAASMWGWTRRPVATRSVWS